MEIGIIVALMIALSVVLSDDYSQRRYNERLRRELWKQWSEDDDWVEPLSCVTETWEELR